SAKETKNTVSYSKSRTKKFFDKVDKTMRADEPQFSLAIIDKESISYAARKGDKAKLAECNYREALLLYADGNSVTVLNINEKLKTEFKSGGTYSDASGLLVIAWIGFNADEEGKGKVFKFKSGEKIYYYEEFYSEYGSMGFLFTEKGTPLAMTLDGSASCISFKTKVEDSEFEVPKGYKTVSTEEFYGS
ncbi:MAG: hypothetical protein NC085_05505, partial [Muribaculaceae bacterium]|nr:hypothetical protein [Muribaculaceae bacterium]